jgi:glucose 1-dehydrogenase
LQYEIKVKSKKKSKKKSKVKANIMEIQLREKIALVTGASTGIGKAIAQALASCGAKVAINYLVKPDVANAVVADIISRGGTAIAIQGDVSDQIQVGRMYAELDKQWGDIDILVNCAGVDGQAALTWNADAKAWKSVIDVNLTGAFYCAQHALSRMKEKKSGVVLNITSVHESIAWTGYGAYTASKAGLSMLTKTMAQEVAPYGVRVLALAPGAIKTEINQSVWSDAASLHDLMDKIPLGRMGDPSEIGRLAAVLVSDVASYVTGTTIFADGGMTDYPSFAHGG